VENVSFPSALNVIALMVGTLLNVFKNQLTHSLVTNRRGRCTHEPTPETEIEKVPFPSATAQLELSMLVEMGMPAQGSPS
jgi:hypothetical protein